MRTRFIACTGCSRHVRAGDERCPFCGAAAPALPPTPRTVQGRVSRAAMLAAGAAGGVLVLVDCSTSPPSNQVFYGVGCTGAACLGREEDASEPRDGAHEVSAENEGGAATDTGPVEGADAHAEDAPGDESDADSGRGAD